MVSNDRRIQDHGLRLAFVASAIAAAVGAFLLPM